ncbi:phage major tail tube protein [Ancylobacter sp. A5.8]|uniref:phage major tail tube protein n=1 Tax=Ancylobacter gelatini TaxID=2919920 RepID=UPI001F4D6EA3|nr:phage major tail tube protein [Ancylobacter gelatini]MCJ8142967.1 phage major tail tube protein [Ancylobacter gelatini]
MDPIKIGHVSNADMYLANNKLTGRVKEFDPGDFSTKVISHEALGMIGVIEIPARGVEAIESSITFDWLDHEVERLVINPTKVHRWAMHSYVDVHGPEGVIADAGHRLITTVGLQFVGRSSFGHTLGEMLNHELECRTQFISQRISTSDVPILEYDPFSGVYRINGENVWSEY